MKDISFGFFLGVKWGVIGLLILIGGPADFVWLILTCHADLLAWWPRAEWLTCATTSALAFLLFRVLR
jgi:hypothetical protein